MRTGAVEGANVIGKVVRPQRRGLVCADGEQGGRLGLEGDVGLGRFWGRWSSVTALSLASTARTNDNSDGMG